MCFSVFCRALQCDLEWGLGFAKSAADRVLGYFHGVLGWVLGFRA